MNKQSLLKILNDIDAENDRFYESAMEIMNYRDRAAPIPEVQLIAWHVVQRKRIEALREGIEESDE